MARKKAQANSSEQEQEFQLTDEEKSLYEDVIDGINSLKNVFEVKDGHIKTPNKSVADSFNEGFNTFVEELEANGGTTKSAADKTLSKDEFKRYNNYVKAIVDGMLSFSQSDMAKQAAGYAAEIESWAEDNKEQIAQRFSDERAKKFIPHLFHVFMKHTENHEDISDKFDEFLRKCFPDGKPTNDQEYFRYIQEAANAKAFADQAATIIKAGIAIEKLNDLQNNQLNEKDLTNLVYAIIPKDHTMPNNALMNSLQSGVKHRYSDPTPIIGAGAFDLIVANKRKNRKELTAYTMVNFSQDEKGQKITDVNLTEYERQVSDAMTSLWMQAEAEHLPPAFTLDTIFRAMPGGSDKASEKQKKDIEATIEKFRNLHLYIDATEELKKRGVIGDTDTFVIDDYYLSASKGTYRTNNGKKKAVAYKLHAEPPVLTYSKKTDQLLTVSPVVIEVKKTLKNGGISTELLSMTKDRQAMTGYMLRRIAIMKHNTRQQSRVIKFDSIFSETQTETTDRKQTMLNRKFCFDVLNYWKSIDYIKGYTQEKSGRSITGILIEL